MVRVTVWFEVETPLTGVEIECLETRLVDEFLADNIKVSQEQEA